MRDGADGPAGGAPKARQARPAGRRPAPRQPRGDLREVPVPLEPVGDEVGVDGAEVGARRRRLAGAADARLGVDHDIVQAQLLERLQGEQRRRRVAAGVGDEVRSRDLVAVQLGEPVDAREHLRERVRAVPLGVRRRVEAEVGRQVDDPGAGVEQVLHRRRCFAVRQADEGEVDALDLGPCAEREVGAQARQVRRERVTGQRLGAHLSELYGRVTKQQLREQGAGVAAAADHGDGRRRGQRVSMGRSRGGARRRGSRSGRGICHGSMDSWGTPGTRRDRRRPNDGCTGGGRETASARAASCGS